MQLKMFTVHDSKAEAFLQPFYDQTTASARRAFGAACNDAEHSFCKFPGDYTLFELGEFDQASGQTKLLDSPINLGLAITYVKQGASDAN